MLPQGREHDRIEQAIDMTREFSFIQSDISRYQIHTEPLWQISSIYPPLIMAQNRSRWQSRTAPNYNYPACEPVCLCYRTCGSFAFHNPRSVRSTWLRPIRRTWVLGFGMRLYGLGKSCRECLFRTILKFYRSNHP